MFIGQIRRESMELSIEERLKDLRVERGLTLEQLAEETHLSKSALGSYEGDNLKDISHHALIQLAKVYEVTVDYLLGRSKTKNHPNADLADLHLSDDMIALLKSGLIDNALLCELAAHPDFPRLINSESSESGVQSAGFFSNNHSRLCGISLGRSHRPDATGWLAEWHRAPGDADHCIAVHCWQSKSLPLWVMAFICILF